MTNVEELKNKIEKTREQLANAIHAKETLLDPEIIFTSKMLDSLLNEYARMQKSKKCKVNIK